MNQSYRIAGIDIHKKMLAVVVTEIGAGGEFTFERRKFGTLDSDLKELSQWLAEREVKVVVMESTGAILEIGLVSAGRAMRFTSGAGAIQPCTARTQTGF